MTRDVPKKNHRSPDKGQYFRSGSSLRFEIGGICCPVKENSLGVKLIWLRGLEVVVIPAGVSGNLAEGNTSLDPSPNDLVGD